MQFVKKYWGRLRQILDFLRPMNIPLHSAYTCFFLVLSLFPGLLLLLGILRYTSLEVDDLVGLVEGFLPQSLMDTVRALITASYRHSSKTVVTISALGSVYSASRGMFGILSGLNAIYDAGQHHNYLRRRGISIVYNLSFILVLLLTLVLYLAGTALLDYLWMTTHPVILFLLQLVDLRALLLLIIQVALFTIMYAFLPGQRNRLRSSLPGAVFAALGWMIFSQLFSVYVEHFVLYSNIYGSVYALALGMLWLYFCICLFFYGGALNRWLEKQRSH